MASKEYDINHGKFLVKLARKAVEEYLKKGTLIQPPEAIPPQLKEKSGAFVTINKLVNNHEELRGCIGYILPIYPLVETVIKAAIAAATEDPRFPPLQPEELDQVIFEVTILTPPKLIKARSPEELLENINIGEDGLLIEWHGFSGTLLPQVPIEYNWDKKTFLTNLCYKAGLPANCWRWDDIKIYKYQGIIFKEEKPNGEIIRVHLKNVKTN